MATIDNVTQTHRLLDRERGPSQSRKASLLYVDVVSGGKVKMASAVSVRKLPPGPGWKNSTPTRYAEGRKKRTNERKKKESHLSRGERCPGVSS